MKNEARSVMMSMNPREREVRVKQEGMTSSHWSSHKNPRIVRVSRGFGGKDRHSKVRTVRGLRDRRIRLSVPTAIQIYDLQHKLGLSQPSKALDWLLDNTKNDIDKLPPLPIIPAESSPPPPPADQTQLQSSLSIHPPYIKDNGQRREKDKWIHHENHEGFGAQLLSAQNFFQSSIPYYNPYYNLPNLSLSHIGGAHPLPEYQSTSQLYFHPTATTIPPIIPTFPSKSLHPHQNDTPRSGKEG